MYVPRCIWMDVLCVCAWMDIDMWMWMDACLDVVHGCMDVHMCMNGYEYMCMDVCMCTCT